MNGEESFWVRKRIKRKRETKSVMTYEQGTHNRWCLLSSGKKKKNVGFYVVIT
jgi:hypothetical protein